MFSELEQACKNYSSESSSGLIAFDGSWQHIFVTALTFFSGSSYIKPKIRSVKVVICGKYKYLNEIK